MLMLGHVTTGNPRTGSKVCIYFAGLTQIQGKVHLEEAIFSQSYKADGDSGDEAACDGYEAAEEDKHGQQSEAWQLQSPHS